MQRVASNHMRIQRLITCNELVGGIWRRGRLLSRSISASCLQHHQQQHHSKQHHSCTLPNNVHSTRLFWSSTDDIAQAVESDNTAVSNESSSLPIPPLTPSNISATSLINPITIESIKSLPECQFVLNLLNGESGVSDDNNESTSASSSSSCSESIINPATINEAHTNLERARDILQSMPEELQMATYLIEVDLLSQCGKFDVALDRLTRYELYINKQHANNNDYHPNEKKKYDEIKVQLQFVKAKLLLNSGQFSHALSEYEDMLEHMERMVERQIQLAMKLQQQQNQQSDHHQNQEEDVFMNNTLPVIHGASALTGVGVTKLLIHTREDFTEGGAAESDIIESIQTATEMLVESRKDAAASPLHSELAIDLGIAASISYTNLGVAHCLLYKKNKRAIKYWNRGIKLLDAILADAVNTAIIIPSYKFQCMESVRARLYCNISSTLLGLNSAVVVMEGGEEKETTSEETLKEASDAAKKALDIYDELINGSKLMRGDGSTGNDDTGNDDDAKSTTTKEGDATSSEDWEHILRGKANSEEDATGPTKKKPKELPISHLWKPYHQSESARALGLVAQCYASAGAAVTAEGLFQSSLDASSSHPIGQSLKDDEKGMVKGVALSSPSLGLIARDVRVWFALLCDDWDKRKGDADRLRSEALKIEDGVLKDFVRDENGTKRSVSGIESSLWLLSPLDFKR